MWRYLYTSGLTLAWPLLITRLLWKSRKDAGYRQRLAERHGLFPHRPRAGGIWLHAVSVGEVQAARPLVTALCQRQPDRPLTLTTTTPTGYRLAQTLFADKVQLAQVPYDLPLCINAFLRRAQPAALVLIETELWPNMVHCCRRAGLPVLLMNARLSASSAANYARWSMLREMFTELSCVGAQSHDDGKRFVALGLPAERLHISGNLKFELVPDALARHQAQEWRTTWAPQQRLVWLAASTHNGEDSAVLDSHLGLGEALADTLLVLAPRHPERCTEIAALCRQRGLRHQLHSAGSPAADTQVLLIDSIGELHAMFGAVDLAFIGGSLVPAGGHNMLEAAVWGVPVISGPHLFNFHDIATRLRDVGALTEAQDSSTLAPLVRTWLLDSTRRQRAGKAAQDLVYRHRGALAAQLQLVESTLEKAESHKS